MVQHTENKFSFGRDVQILMNMSDVSAVVPELSALANHSVQCGWDSRFNGVQPVPIK